VGSNPLLLRTLARPGWRGIRRVAITVGFDAQRVPRSRGHEARRSTLPELVFFDNPAWERPNGLSVLAARKFITERTLLVMSDQIAAPHLVREMAKQPCEGELTVLAVDPDLSRVFDFDDATKVKLWDHNCRVERSACPPSARILPTTTRSVRAVRDVAHAGWLPGRPGEDQAIPR
jgi:choline kinase